MSELTPEQLQRNRELMVRQANDTIARVGWMIQGVFSTDDAPPFAYTIGLSQFNLPELLLVGLNGHTAAGILNPIAEKMKVDKEAIKVGPTPSGFKLRTGEDLRLAVRHVDDKYRAVTEYLIQAYDRYGSRLNVMQVIWADDKNVLPTEPGYNLSMTQPLI